MTREAFAEKAMAMQDTLFRVSFGLLPSRYDQEDAVQETMRIALQKLHTLREERYFGTWLVRILINECYAIGRKKKREIPTEEILESLPTDSDTEVMEVLMLLDIKQRLPLILHYVEGYSIAEVAQMVGVPQGTIKTRMARGRQAARSILDEGGHGHGKAI